jgi:hypothetical protein
MRCCVVSGWKMYRLLYIDVEAIWYSVTESLISSTWKNMREPIRANFKADRIVTDRNKNKVFL